MLYCTEPRVLPARGRRGARGHSLRSVAGPTSRRRL